MSDELRVLEAMMDYFHGDPRRINHFLKVYSFASVISEKEELEESTRNLIKIAAIVHDIGIKISEKKYNSSSGHYQQIEGPDEARKLLMDLGFENKFIERICWLIAHHHKYKDIEGEDYQILVEADFLVNIYEDNMNFDQIETIKNKIFRTKTGIRLLETLYVEN